MAITFTPEQQKVIELHNRNILVSAAAGSGKTAVLVERIIQMICDEAHPVDIDRLLIVTFTNAAAAEMRERIAEGIGAKLLENPKSEHIQKQSTLLHNALITTIDSFSLFIIRNHFNEIGLDPTFRVADEGEIKLLKQEVLGELLEDSFASLDKRFLECVEYFCPGGRESVLEQHILNLSRYAASFPWPKEWLMQRKQDYEADSVDGLINSDYGEYLKKHVNYMLKGCLDKLKEAIAICQMPDGPYMYGELLETEAELLEKFLACNNPTEYATKLEQISFGRLPVKKDDSVSVTKRELAKSLRGEVKDILQKLKEQFFTTPLELALEQGRACMEPVGALIDLVLDFDRRMQLKKQEKKLIDFSDMEHYALDILIDKQEGELRPSAVALEYRQYFHEILIDEYQDSNLVQEYLLKAVSGEEEGNFNRFMVGDVKQSIYKFRLARPELFLEKYDTYQGEGDCQRIDLSKNFRSRVQVIHSVNQVFSRIMSKEIGGISYDEHSALYPGASYPENPSCESELLLVEKPKGNKDLSAKQAEALAIAKRIKELLTTLKVTDKATGNLRPVQFRDMVILLRTNSGWDEEFKESLEKEGIPVYITSKTGYFAATEVQELLQVLRVLNNPGQDIALFGMMKSIFGGFSEEEIAMIRAGEKELSLYRALTSYEGEEGLQNKVANFLQTLQRYREYSVYMPIRELLQHLVDEFNYLHYVTALPAGSKRKANVEMLFTKAAAFENTSYFGLFHFIRYMEQLEKYDVDYGEADTLDENADVVRIMSIHKSKGLEFPVTFVAGLSKRFNMQDVNQALIVDMDLGLATDYVDAKKRIRNKTFRRAIISRKMREDNLAEELRVLYVALTRAKEKLILSATLEKAEEKWELYRDRKSEHLSYVDFIQAASYLDFLLPILSQTSFKVLIQDVEKLLGEEIKEQIHLSEKKAALEHPEKAVDEEALLQLNTRFTYQYPHSNLAGLYTKTTVSELKIAAMSEADEEAYHAFEEKEVVPYIPAFKRKDEEVSGTVRGNAYHRAMELMDFEKIVGVQFAAVPKTYEQYTEELQIAALEQALHEHLLEMVEELRLPEEYFKVLKEQKLIHFLQTQLAYRMWKAEREGNLYKEQPFVFGIAANRLQDEFPEDEKVLIQGIIDVFFVENNEIVLLDYKTDVIESLKDLWKRYEVQMDYYGEALTKLWQLPIKEKYLYSFYLEKYGEK